MGFCELLIEFELDLQVCAKRQGDCMNAIEAGMRAHQFSGGRLESSQGFLHIPTFADKAINLVNEPTFGPTTESLCWVHGNASFSGSADHLQEARADKWKPPPFESEGTKRANEWCGPAAPFNGTKGFYKSNKRKAIIAQ
jgi:hypothetical protein